MLTITLPSNLIELAIDIALDDARSILICHEDMTGETNPHTAKEIARLEAIEKRLIEDPNSHIALNAEEIATISFFVSEWKSNHGISRITHDLLDC